MTATVIVQSDNAQDRDVLVQVKNSRRDPAAEHRLSDGAERTFHIHHGLTLEISEVAKVGEPPLVLEVLPQDPPTTRDGERDSNAKQRPPLA